MYIAKGYFETRFKKSFREGDIVPNEIAELYLSKVNKEGNQELLFEAPSVVETEVQEIVEETEVQEIVEETEVQEIVEEVKSLSNFNEKNDLEEYGRTLGVELDKRDKLKNMYKDLLKKIGK